ncbi:hypothetical protein GE21DRAFT_6860 [Neurospora crassa]|uniref:Uncharacterized protein n=1 Tax=Neurospora crassa (strain ATCC 24698 / 74-OR23-1A / CBS 708.71 / DSM 1257 / FGSC 987) TaxID=367110 RepID=Q7S1D1_NEUCR|nr:hypothetical protein NCU07797 [Neurospora crassa OR74A]EAA29147.1 hypothetical protein NCU07797 [Neurospora crassa OR74A]KHE80290.1 hypothetical protein GE21DRAFT_6860 [Neurospora crassa]|eukprot:XP_958383.1 hypothetical protein NCU07797 [Neurospora crassa OR74A]
MEKDAALPVVNHEFVGGRIMWLPKKEEIEAGNLPALDDKLFDHPVLIISEHREEQTDIVRVLIITTFAKEGLKTRFGRSLACRFYLPLPGAPAHPCAKSRADIPSNLTFVEEDGNEKALCASWINARASYSVPYQCLINWKNMQRTPTLTKESLRDVINYHTERVPKIERWEQVERSSKEEKEKRIDERRSRTSWRTPPQHPVSETRGVVSTTTYPPEMSISQSAVMLVHTSNDRYIRSTRWIGQVQRKGKGECPPGCLCCGCCDYWRDRRSASSDPPRSKSISALIPTPESHVCRVVGEGPIKKTYYNKNRGFRAQPSQGRLFTENSATICQKPLVSAPTEVLGMASFDVLSQDTGVCDALAWIQERQSVHVWQWFLRPR